MKPPRARRPGPRRLCTIAFVFLGIVFAYPVAANLMLALGGVQKMFEGTDQVKLDFRRAWTFWPGQVHVEGVRLTMQDHNVQFSLELSRADVTLRLRDFFHRTLHATKVRGDGVVFRFRHRIEPESADAPWVAALPPIFEFEDPPLRAAGARPAPLDEAHYNLWTVHMEDVDVRVRELWVQMFRYEGDARARGAFRLRPAKRLWVEPGELTLTGGKVSTGPHDLLHAMEGGVTVKVDDFDTEPVFGLEPFRFIFARFRLLCQVSHLDAVNFLTGPSAQFQLDDGSGAIDMDLSVDHGRLTPESHFSYRTSHAGVGASGAKFHGDGELAVLLTGPAGAPGAKLTVDLARGALRLAESAHEPLQLRGLEASVVSTCADVMQTCAPAGGYARLAGATLTDLAWLNDLPLGKRAWAFAGGRGRASGAITVSPDDDVEGSVDAAVEDASGTAGKLSWRGSARLDGEASFSDKGGMRGHLQATTRKFKADVEGKRLVVSSLSGALRFTDKDARGSVQIRNLRASSSSISGATSRAKLDGSFSFPAKKGSAGEVRGTTAAWTADLGDSRLVGSSASTNLLFSSERILGNFKATDIQASSLSGVCPFAEMKSASVAGHLLTPEDAPATGRARGSFDGLSLRWGEFTAAANRMAFSGGWDGKTIAARLDSTKIHLKNDEGAPKSWQADATATSIQTSLSLADGEVRGPLHVDVQQIVGQVGKTKIGGDIVASLYVLSKDKSHRTADVTGVVQARKVALSSKQHHTDDWWADFKIDSAHVDTRQNLDVAGKVRASFRDALPALNVLASTEEIPAWVPTILPLQGITLDLGVERYCRWSDVQVLDASGGPLSAKGRFQFEPGETRGAIVLRLASLGFVSVGLDFVEDYSNTSPLVGASWLEEHLLPMTKAATDVHDAVCRPEPPTCP